MNLMKGGIPKCAENWCGSNRLCFKVLFDQKPVFFILFALVILRNHITSSLFSFL
jgi:hypothetical protein